MDRNEQFRESIDKTEGCINNLHIVIQELEDINLNKYFEPLKNYIEAVVKSKNYLNSLFVYSEGGLGKTTTVLSKLKQLKKPYVYISNYTTIVEFVNFLYENNDKIIVMDDMEGIWKLGDKILNVLKGVLWGIGKNNKRIITYMTTDKRLRTPQQFEFKGKIFFLLNKMPNENDSLVKALLSRSLIYKIEFSYDELIKVLAEFIKIPYKNLTLKERTEIYDYLIENIDENCEDLNFRTLIKMYDLYLINQKLWKSLCNGLIKKNKKMYLLRKYLKEENTIKQAQIKFCEEMGYSRRQFFNLKAKVSAKVHCTK